MKKIKRKIKSNRKEWQRNKKKSKRSNWEKKKEMLKMLHLLQVKGISVMKEFSNKKTKQVRMTLLLKNLKILKRKIFQED